MRYLLILISCFISFFFNAQEIEKLQKELRSNPQTRMQTAAKLRDIYSDLSADSSYSLGNYLLKQGISDDNQPVMMYGKLILSNYYNGEGKTEISIKYLTDCVNYYTLRGDDEKLADAQNLLGIAYIYDAQYNKAASWLIKSIKTADKLGKDNESYMAQINLTEVYIREKRFDLAEAEALSFIEKSKSKNLMNGVKKGYDYLAKIYMMKDEMPLAIEYYKKALDLALKNNSKIGKANAYNNIAIAHYETGDMQLSLENFKKALQLRLELNQPVGISESYFNLGDWNFYQNKFDDAIVQYKISLDVAKHNNLTKEMSDANKMIAESYQAKGDFREAFIFLNQHLTQLDLMQEKNQIREIDMQRASYEVEREEQKLNQKKREAKFQNRVDNEQDRGRIIVIGFSLLVGSLIISYFLLLARNTKRNSEIANKNGRNMDGAEQNSIMTQWKKIESFIAENQNTDYKNAFFPLPERLKLIQGIQLMSLQDNQWFYWEAPVSKLENYVLNEFLHQQKNQHDTQNLLLAIENQTLIDGQNLSYGIIAVTGDEITVSGKNGLLIQGPEKISFITENENNIDQLTILVSEKLKNELVESAQWEKFLDQADMAINMSPKMAYQTLDVCWKELLVKENLGMIVIFPANN